MRSLWSQNFKSYNLLACISICYLITDCEHWGLHISLSPQLKFCMPRCGICNPKTRYWVVRCICRRRLVVQRRWKTYVVCTLGCYRGSCATMAKAWRSKHAQKCCKRVRALSRSNLKWNRIKPQLTVSYLLDDIFICFISEGLSICSPEN